ncbi:MAG: hypothetical protein WC756_21695 [Taibaiella sp.]|jgi:hypothetical protein
MPIDYNIPLQVQTPKFQTPFEMMGQYAAIQGQQGENQLTQRKLKAYDDADTQANMLSGIVRDNTDPTTGKFNFAGAKPGMIGIGMGKEALDMEKSQADIELKQLETKAKLYEHVGQVLGGYTQLRPEDITPEIEARYQNDVAGLHQTVGAKLDIPDQLDIPTLQVKFQQGMSAKDQNAARIAELSAQREQEKFGYQKQRDERQFALQQRGQDINALNQQQNYEQRERGIEATRINKPLSPQQQKMSDADAVLSILKEAKPLIEKSTASYIGTGADIAARAVGYGTKGANAAAQLKALQGNLVSKMPKMSGPQSDKDVQLYKEMAGQMGDSTLPISTRKAAMDTIYKINAKYASPEAVQQYGNQEQPPQQPIDDISQFNTYEDYLKANGVQ